MTNFYLQQLAVFFFAVFSTFEEEGFTFPFREIFFDTETKFRKLKKAHRAGAAGVFCILILPLTNGFTVINGLESLDLFFIYWLVFDIGYALQIGERWCYLGGTAGLDGLLKRVLGKYAGQIKAGIALLCIIAINLVINKL